MSSTVVAKVYYNSKQQMIYSVWLLNLKHLWHSNLIWPMYPIIQLRLFNRDIKKTMINNDDNDKHFFLLQLLKTAPLKKKTSFHQCKALHRSDIIIIIFLLFCSHSLDLTHFIFHPALGLGVVNISFSRISVAKIEHAS